MHRPAPRNAGAEMSRDVKQNGASDEVVRDLNSRPFFAAWLCGGSGFACQQDARDYETAQLRVSARGGSSYQTMLFPQKAMTLALTRHCSPARTEALQASAASVFVNAAPASVGLVIGAAFIIVGGDFEANNTNRVCVRCNYDRRRGAAIGKCERASECRRCPAELTDGFICACGSYVCRVGRLSPRGQDYPFSSQQLWLVDEFWQVCHRRSHSQIQTNLEPPDPSLGVGPPGRYIRERLFGWRDIGFAARHRHCCAFSQLAVTTTARHAMSLALTRLGSTSRGTCETTHTARTFVRRSMPSVTLQP